ncbi:MAG: AsmA-like C-terminal domain-containing protein [Alphaproteobacteria bacterium]|nr:AsmA-like C-terminal domain-containing protein [Alphaproteobacteria bacterium]
MIRKAGGILGTAIAAVLSIVTLALIGTGVMLSHGPVSIAPLVPYLEDLLDDQSWRFRIRIDDAVLSWEGWQKKLDIRVMGARFVDRRGAELISVPSLSVAFDSRALLVGRLRVTGLELIQPRLRLLRDANGRIEISNTESTGKTGIGRGISFDPGELIGAGQTAGVAVFGDLRRLSVRAANLSFHDAASGLDLSVPSADLSLHQKGDSVALSLSTRLRIGQSEAAWGLSALYRDASSPIVMAVNFAEVDIAGLAEAIGSAGLAQMRGLQVVAAGHLDLALLPTGTVDRLEFDVTTGPGQITLPGLQGEAMPVAAVAAKGRFADNLNQLNITHLRLDMGGGLTAEASGQWGQGADGMSLQGKGQIYNVPAEKLQLYWPENLGVDARTWLLAHLRGGMAHEARFSVDLRPGDLKLAQPRAEMVQLDWSYRNVAADYFGTLPPVQDARGSGHIDGREFRLTLDSATAGGLQLSEGSLHVADIFAKPAILDAEFVAHGTVQQALAVLDAKPLEFAKALAIRPEDATGMSATRARLSIPLRDDLSLAQVGFSTASNLAELALLKMPGGYALSDGVFSLAVERGALQMSGQGALNGVPLQLSWKRDFQAKPDAPGDFLTIRGRAAETQWQALGLPAMPQVRGAVDMAVSIDAYKNGARRGAARFDLTAAAIDLNEIAWRKASGAPAELKLTFQTEAVGGTVVDYWNISGGGLNARGRAKLDPKAGLVSLHSDEFAFGATRLMVDMTAQPDGGYRLDLKGPSLDLRPFLPGWRDTAATAEAEPPLELNLHVEQVFLTDGVALGKLRGSGSRRGGKWQTADMHGIMADGQSVGFIVRAEGKGRRFIIIAGDAGGIASALDLYDNARGGAMHLTFLVPDQDGPAATIVGQLRADNFRVVKAPVLTRLLTLGSLQGLGDVLNDKGIAFTRLDVPFTLRGDLLHMERARAVGPALALIASGDYERSNQALQFQGTIVPSYTINSVLGAIPILGNLLIGRKGEGIFAFTYTITGNLEKPNVSVNLLSALAPGFLRRIVEGLDSPAVENTEQGRENAEK